MRRISFCVAGLVLALATVAAANPGITGSVVITRVWNDCPGRLEKQFRFKQSFQSARPIKGSP